MARFHEKIYQMLKNLLQLSPETKHCILSWLGNCLHANAGRTKIWANQMPEIFFQMYASDAFFLNLGAALLKLCQPFCKPRSSRLLTFNPTYCALKELNDEERKIKNVHMRGRGELVFSKLCVCNIRPSLLYPFPQRSLFLKEDKAKRKAIINFEKTDLKTDSFRCYALLRPSISIWQTWIFSHSFILK